jgi:hypothetical protein
LLQTESVCLFATDSALVAGSNRCQVSYGNSMVAATRPPPDKIGVAIAALPHSAQNVGRGIGMRCEHGQPGCDAVDDGGWEKASIALHRGCRMHRSV